MIRFSCPRCDGLLQVPDEQAGTKTRCPNPSCNQKLLVPGQPAGGDSVAQTMLGRAAPSRPARPAVAPAGPSPRVQTPTAPARPARVTKGSADGGDRGRLFERIGVGAFAVVVAVILVGLFMVLFPLIHSGASRAPAAAAPASPADADHGKAEADAAREMRPEQVTAKVKPSVALIENRMGSGSGFLVEGGFVVTNSHVVADDTIAGVTVTFPSSESKSEKYKVHLAYEDRVRDLAILRLENPPTIPPRKLNTATLAEGQDVLAIGSPGVYVTEGGLSENSADKGTLSNPNFHSSQFNDAKRDLRYVQHSAKINHGNSGGPLLDMHAEVIGVNVIGLDSLGLDGIKLAIPTDELQVIIGKARDRNAAQVDHATATHDAFAAFSSLDEAVVDYHDAGLYCFKAAADAKKAGKDPGPSYAAAFKAIVTHQALRPNGQKYTDPIQYRNQVVQEQWADITDLLSGAALDDADRAKLHQLLRQQRDLFVECKNRYEDPSLDGVVKMLEKIESDYPDLQSAIKNEFASVF